MSRYLINSVGQLTKRDYLYIMDSRQLIAVLHRENLCTYFVLPLLKLNKASFVSDLNFVDSYLVQPTDSDWGMSIVVKVQETDFFEHRMIMHPHYVGMWKDDKFKYVQYAIPFKWKEDVKIFMEGKYSYMSLAAKEMINTYSGLKYRVRRESDHKPVTDVRLLALDRSIAVREIWEEFYDMCIDEKDELLSKPSEKSYLDISGFTKVQPFTT